jgi:hypothetical protein
MESMCYALLLAEFYVNKGKRQFYLKNQLSDFVYQLIKIDIHFIRYR